MGIFKDKITQLEVYFHTNFNSKRPVNLNHVRVVFWTHTVVGLKHTFAVWKYILPIHTEEVNIIKVSLWVNQWKNTNHEYDTWAEQTSSGLVHSLCSRDAEDGNRTKKCSQACIQCSWTWDAEDGNRTKKCSQACIRCSLQSLQMPINVWRILWLALSCIGRKLSCLEGQGETWFQQK